MRTSIILVLMAFCLQAKAGHWVEDDNDDTKYSTAKPKSALDRFDEQQAELKRKAAAECMALIHMGQDPAYIGACNY